MCQVKPSVTTTSESGGGCSRARRYAGQHADHCSSTVAASSRRVGARSALSLALAVCLTARGSIRTRELSIARLGDNVAVPPSRAIERSRAQFLAATLVAVLLALAWTLPISRHEITDGDFPSHLKTAEEVAASPHIPAPHFLFFGSVASLLVIFPQLTSTSA